MRFGVTLPNAGLGNDPTVLAELASEAEGSGWDGVFVWDAGVPDHDIAQDPRDPSLAPVIEHDPAGAAAYTRGLAAAGATSSSRPRGCTCTRLLGDRMRFGAASARDHRDATRERG